MYVCLCNRVTDRELVEAATAFASEPEARISGSFAERVANQLGVGLGCGTCREFALDLVERAATRRSMIVLPDCVAASPGLEVPLAERCNPSLSSASPSATVKQRRLGKTDADAAAGRRTLLETPLPLSAGPAAFESVAPDVRPVIVAPAPGAVPDGALSAGGRAAR